MLVCAQDIKNPRGFLWWQWLLKRVRLVCKILLHCGPLLFVLSLDGAGMCDDGFDSDDGMPPPKKMKKDDVEEPSCKGEVASRIFTKLYKSEQHTCKSDDLACVLGGTRRGPQAVREAVVDLMFRRNVFVTYDPKNSTYCLGRSAAGDKKPPCDMRSALAYIVTATAESKNIPLGILGYFLFQKGFRAEHYPRFRRVYYAMCLFCNKRMTRSLLLSKDFIDFAQKRGIKNYREALKAYKLTEQKPLDDQQRLIAKYILELSVADVQKMENAKQEALQREASSEGGPLRRYMETLLLWEEPELCEEAPVLDMSDTNDGDAIFLSDESPAAFLGADVCLNVKAPAEDIGHAPGKEQGDGLENSVWKSRQSDVFPRALEVAVAHIISQENIQNFKQLVEAMKGWRYAKYSRKDLCVISETVRILCSKHLSSDKKLVMDFVHFVQMSARPSLTTLEEHLSNYPGKLPVRLKESAQCVLSMSEEVLQTVQTIVIPPWYNKTRKGGAKPGWKKCNKHNLVRKLCESARNCEVLACDDVVPFLRDKKGLLDVLRQILSVALQEGFNVHCKEEGRFELYYRTKPAPLVYVPAEVVVAGRFCGEGCSPRARMFFMQSLHQAGYTFGSLKELSNIFDATCVVCDIAVSGATCIERCRKFWKFIKKSPTVKNLEEYIAEYPDGVYIMRNEQALMEAVCALMLKGTLFHWGLKNFKSLTQEDVRQRKEDLLVKILKEYAKQEVACPLTILDLIEGAGEQGALAAVMTAVLKRDLHIVYNKAQGTCLLKPEPNRRTAPQEGFMALGFKYIFANPSLAVEDFAYNLYDAGCRRPYTTFQDLHTLCTVLSSQEGASMVQKYRRLVEKALQKMSTGEHHSSLLSPDTELPLDGVSFVQSLGRLYKAQELSWSAVQKILANPLMFYKKTCICKEGVVTHKVLLCA